MSQTVLLSQEDFATGTYRIRSPGTYILTEDIEFDPLLDPDVRPDLPLSGFWFAAISVETNNVIIRLRGHTLQASQNYINKNLANVFSDIELANTPYPGPNGTFATPVFVFRGDTSFVAANKVLIRGGILGRSSHWGIHGSNNKKIRVKNVWVRDFEVGGIVIQAPQKLTIKKVKITGLEHLITVRSTTTAAFTAGVFLTQFSALPPPLGAAAQGQLAALQQYVATNPEDFAPTDLPDGTYYGIFVSSGSAIPTGVVNPGFPTTPELCQVASQASDGQTARNLVFSDIKISNLKNRPIETVTVGSQIPGQFGFDVTIGLLGVFGVLPWFYLFDAEGNFAPNAFIQALAFVAQVQYAVTPEQAALLPPNTPAILEAILTGNADLFFANAQPEFGRNFNVFPNRGIFGLRDDCTDSACINNVKFNNIQNVGPIGLTLADIPQGSRYQYCNFPPQLPCIIPQRYIGNDAWEIEVASANKVNICNTNGKNIISENGFAFGIDLITDVSNSNVICNKISDIISNRQAPETDFVNPSSISYGIRVEDTTGVNKIIDNIIRNVRSAGEAIPIEISNAPNTIVKNIIINPTNKCK